jgi:hypothetical protein
LSSISTSGSDFEDARCNTVWMSVGPGTDSWFTLATPIDVPHFCSMSPTCDLPGSSV